MSDHAISATVAIILAVIGVAALALLVSKQAQTGSVLGAGGSTFSQMLRCALSPITGDSCSSGRSLISDVTSTIDFGNITTPFGPGR